jgi:argininosuccinate lyase
LEKGAELNDLTLDELRAFGPEFDEDFFPAITLTATLACHDVVGGTAHNQVREAITLASKHIAFLEAANLPEAAHAGA